MPIDREALISLREAKPLTQAELGELCGISDRAVWSIENGQTVAPRPSTVRALAEALDVETEVLMGGKGSGRKAKKATDAQLMGRLRKAGRNDPPPPSVAANARKAFKNRKAS